MKKVIAVLTGVGLAILASALAHGQTVNPPGPVHRQLVNLYAAGVSYNSGNTSSVAGTALYARGVNKSGTYAFTVIDALPAKNTVSQPVLNPPGPTQPFITSTTSSSTAFTVTTNIGVGIAQKLFSIGKVDIFSPTAAGISWTGTNTGWEWNAGAMAVFKLKGNYYLMPTVRMIKSSVSGGAGYQPIVGVLFGWGK